MDEALPTPAEGVCELRVVRGPGVSPDSRPEVLIELPHGATRELEYRQLERRLRSPLPEGLIDFFFVNTDVGSPECAEHVARMVADPRAFPQLAGLPAARPRAVAILRSRIPRTFVDCNRALDGDGPGAGLTPALPGYVSDSADVSLLSSLHRRYHETARRTYGIVCGSGGLALTLHTYAPRSVGITRVDSDIVGALRAAYEPAVYDTWPRRPDVDVIASATDGSRLADERIVDAVRRHYAAIGIEATDSRSYRLDPSTMGHRYAVEWPRRVVCVEISRALLAAPFEPFREMTIGDDRTRRMALPLAAALSEALTLE